KAGDVVSFQLPNWVETMIINLAAGLSGIVVNPIVPIYRESEVRYILRDARAKVFLIPHHFRNFDYTAMAARLRGEVPSLEHLIVVRSDAQRLEELGGAAGARPSRASSGWTDRCKRREAAALHFRHDRPSEGRAAQPQHHHGRDRGGHRFLGHHRPRRVVDALTRYPHYRLSLRAGNLFRGGRQGRADGALECQ